MYDTLNNVKSLEMLLKFSDYNSQTRFNEFSKLSPPWNQISNNLYFVYSSAKFRNMALVPLKNKNF